ncbi:winged helix-turn-helix transcriptional regulator [Enterococcus faecium]|nr:winged helix-turn-helix transcriptional regulator [Enterococcus faecium]
MAGFPHLQQTTKLLAEHSRLEILTLLMDGRFHTVHELAKKAKIKDHTASYHIKKLHSLDWVMSYKQGRNVYYRLSSLEIADLLENLMVVSPVKPIKSFNENKEYSELKAGRSCYRHLAGVIGVVFFNFLLHNNYLVMENHHVELTEEGVCYFKDLGIDIDALKKQSGVLVKPCLDWTERTFHLGGNLGNAFFRWCKEKEYITLNPENRGVRLIAEGNLFFQKFESSQ